MCVFGMLAANDVIVDLTQLLGNRAHLAGSDISEIHSGDGSDLSRGAGQKQLISQENLGVSIARNRGIQAASGQWIAFLDADDKWRPGHLDRLERGINDHPEAGLIHAQAMVIDE